MNKGLILKAVIAELEDELRRQMAAQATAAEGATHAESKAETKWDTCGLEQSYLARGLAQQFQKLAKQVEDLRAFKPSDCTDKPIRLGALVEAEMDGYTDWFFLLECGGGMDVKIESREITVITPESPVGAALLEKKAGDTYSFRSGKDGRILHVE